MLPDLGSTAHMIQGATLEAAIVDLQHWVEQGIDHVADCRVRLPVESEAADEHMYSPAVLYVPLQSREPRRSRASHQKAVG